MLRKDDFFHHRVIVILSHRQFRTPLCSKGNTDCIAFSTPSGTSQSNWQIANKLFIFSKKEVDGVRACTGR